MLESKDAKLNKEDQLLVEVLKPGTSELTDLLI
jgi:hypothetical protein